MSLKLLHFRPYSSDTIWKGTQGYSNAKFNEIVIAPNKAWEIPLQK